METLTTDSTHHHHWIIETANGPKSDGVCKYCHLRREFPNSSERFDFTGSGGRDDGRTGDFGRW